MKRFLGLLALCGLVVGCGGGGGKTTLTGKLILNGAPIQKAEGELVQLQLLPESGGDGSHMADVATDGTYTIVTSGGAIPPGKYKVVVLGQTGGAPNPKAPPTDRFKGKYSRDNSKIVITVNPGDNRLDIKLD